MTELFNLFKNIAETYGLTVAIIIIFIVLIVYIFFLMPKKNYSIFRSYMEAHSAKINMDHIQAVAHRKNVTPQIRRELSNLAEHTDADRVLLFEFSNGSSNLVGLPFLYATATCEVVTCGTSQVANLYQKMNTTLFAPFLEQLEARGYFYVEDIESIKYTHATIYNLLLPNGVKTAIFYSIYGVDDTIGFVVATTIKDNTFTRDHGLPRIASSAQVVSSLLNFEKIKNI